MLNVLSYVGLSLLLWHSFYSSIFISVQFITHWICVVFPASVANTELNSIYYAEDVPNRWRFNIRIPDGSRQSEATNKIITSSSLHWHVLYCSYIYIYTVSVDNNVALRAAKMSTDGGFNKISIDTYIYIPTHRKIPRVCVKVGKK